MFSWDEIHLKESGLSLSSDRYHCHCSSLEISTNNPNQLQNSCKIAELRSTSSRFQRGTPEMMVQRLSPPSSFKFTPDAINALVRYCRETATIVASGGMMTREAEGFGFMSVPSGATY